jgi:hypothetical protein
MFHFGLLSSFIPYVLVAILYILGMTNYAKAMFDSKSEENNSEILISQDHSEKSYDNDSSCFSAFQDYTTVQTTSSQKYIDEDVIHKYTHNNSFKEIPFSSYFVSRPPPSLFA